MKTVTLTLVGSGDLTTLNVSSGSGSFVYSGSNPALLCRLKIEFGPEEGRGEPGTSVSFHHLNDGGFRVTDRILKDFTGGAVIRAPILAFGPKYGVTHIVADAGGCLDTACFWALAPRRHYRLDTLAVVRHFPAGGGQLLSDGRRLWLWGIAPTPGSSDDGVLNIVNFNESPYLSHPFHDLPGNSAVVFDETMNAIWIVDRTQFGADTAWAYDSTGHCDSSIVSPAIPVGSLCDGVWFRESGCDARVRTIQSFDWMGNLLGTRDYPAELTYGFSGQAGFSLPGDPDLHVHSLNVFDSNGDWDSRFRACGDEYAYEFFTSASVMTNGSRIVYAVTSSSIYEGMSIKICVLSKEM
jgi:hypothetical protein